MSVPTNHSLYAGRSDTLTILRPVQTGFNSDKAPVSIHNHSAASQVNWQQTLGLALVGGQLSFSTHRFIVNERGDKSGSRPYEHASQHHNLPVVAVAQVAKERGDYHVADYEHGLKQSDWGVLDIEILLDLQEHA